MTFLVFEGSSLVTRVPELLRTMLIPCTETAWPSPASGRGSEQLERSAVLLCGQRSQGRLGLWGQRSPGTQDNIPKPSETATVLSSTIQYCPGRGTKCMPS